MKLIRNISATELIKKLKVFGYKPTRQTGSHIRLTTYRKGTHHITIPNHKVLRIGTLSAILNSIAEHFKKSKEDLINELF